MISTMITKDKDLQCEALTKGTLEDSLEAEGDCKGEHFTQGDIDFWAFVFLEWVKENGNVFWKQPVPTFEPWNLKIMVTNQDPKMTKDEANRALSFGIKLLKQSTQNIPEALVLRNRLRDDGFWWQADRMSNWINRYWKDYVGNSAGTN